MVFFVKGAHSSLHIYCFPINIFEIGWVNGINDTLMSCRVFLFFSLSCALSCVVLASLMTPLIYLTLTLPLFFCSICISLQNELYKHNAACYCVGMIKITNNMKIKKDPFFLKLIVSAGAKEWGWLVPQTTKKPSLHFFLLV